MTQCVEASINITDKCNVEHTHTYCFIFKRAAEHFASYIITTNRRAPNCAHECMNFASFRRFCFCFEDFAFVSKILLLF